MRTKIKEKSLTPAGFEPTTSWLEHRRSTNWATRPGWVTLWSKYFITLFVTHAKTGWLGKSCLDLYYHCKHVKNTINHQLLKFTPLRLVSYVAVIVFWTPRAERTTIGVNAPGAFSCYPAVRTGSSNTHFFSVVFFFFFWWSLAPDLRFSLGQTNTRRVFRYTGKGFYLEWP